MLKSRVITAIVMLILLLCVLFWLPPLAWSILVLAIVMQGAAEWSRMSELTPIGAKLYWGATLILMVAILLLDANSTPEQQTTTHLIAYLLAAVLWLVVVPPWLMMGWKVKQPMLMAMVGWMLLIPTGLAMIDLREAAPAPWILLGVMGLVWVADSAAYFAGRRFGKTKLAPSISPGKTWEGVAGAIAGVSVYIGLIFAFRPEFDNLQMLPALMITAWWWVVLAVIGDLFESAIRRQAGIKDSGALLPGHGGLLDRIDALTSTLPLAALALIFQGLS